MKTVRPGQLMYWQNGPYIVLELKGLSEAIIRSLDGGRTDIVRVSDLTAAPETTRTRNTSHLMTNESQWDVAVKRFELIKPLLDSSDRSRQSVDAVAEAAGKSSATIYRWIRRFEETGLVSSLLKSTRSDKGEGRLSTEVEGVIDHQINEYFLRRERPSVAKLYEQICFQCVSLDLPAPHRNTVYARAREIDNRELLSSRYSPRHAREKLTPLRGSFPPAAYPYAVVQIDHTPVDVVVVDEAHRLPIGRPYLTIAIDVATKMVGGFVMTLDPPSASTAGLCISHAATRKEHWLAKRDILAEWPLYGKMQKIHVDNAKEFRGKMLARAAEQHGIVVEHRPKGQPNYGPHVERAFRTFMSECQTLPGTTFSNVAEKMKYDSEGNACFTLPELELWFAVFLTYCYHHRPHKGINEVPPIKLLQQLVHGSETQPGTGLPAPIDDEQTFRLDFTPYVERTIQRSGVVIDNIHYYAPILRRWIDTKDPGTRNARKFIFARDPRDISTVYFFDPATNDYCSIPYFNATRPAISLWELQAVTKRLKEDPALAVDEDMIFKGIARMREIEAEAIEKTRLARQQRGSEKRKRRMAERRKGWARASDNMATAAAYVPTTESDQETFDLEPYLDIQVN